MKLLTRVFLGLSLVFATLSPALADGVDTSGLTSQQISDLQKKADELKKPAASTTDKVIDTLTDPATLNQWANAGENIGQALAGAAKVLGQGVSDFSKTEVGRLVTWIVLWKLFGKSIVLLGFSLLFLLVPNAFGLWIYIKRAFSRDLVYMVLKDTQVAQFSHIGLPEGAKLIGSYRAAPHDAWGETDEDRNANLAIFCVCLAFFNAVGIICLINV